MVEKAKLNVDGVLSLEASFVKVWYQPQAMDAYPRLTQVPFEQLKKASRTSQKYIEKEMTNLSKTIADLAKSSSSSSSSSSSTASVKTLDAMIERLGKLKRKASQLDEIRSEEVVNSTRTRARLDHLNELSDMRAIDSDEYRKWSRVRMDRLILDYLLREGYAETAAMLAKTEGMEDFVDKEFFAASRKTERSLERYSCTECLAWCADNKSNLKRIKSSLEFNLRMQEFIELARQRQLTAAIAYAKKHFEAWTDTHLRDIQQVMALLAFPPTTQCQPYKSLYNTERWHALALQFRSDNYSLHTLAPQSTLATTLQAGLSALKTVACYQDGNRNVNCPVCARDTYNVLAEKLPLGHHVNSCYVCRITGDIMDEDNLPMVTPEGYVYSRRAMSEMAQHNDGQVRCPRTGTVFKFTQLRKMYIT
ncbi:GID complex subunit containing RING finger motif [Sorochytrium milnesiophthora]